MTLKLNNRQVNVNEFNTTSSTAHNDKYFDDKLVQMLPNSNSHLITGKSQRDYLKYKCEQTVPYAVNTNNEITINAQGSLQGEEAKLYEERQYEHKIYSGFSSSKYIHLSNTLNFNTTSWEIITKIKTANNVSTSQKPFHFYKESGNSGRFGIGLTIASGKFDFFVSSSGSSWLFDLTGNYTVLANTTYWVKASYDGTTYKLSYSLDGINYNDDITYTSSSLIYSPLYGNFGIYSTSSLQDPFLGFIDFTDTIIKIDNSIVFDGSMAVEGTDYTNIGCTESTEIVTTNESLPYSFGFSLPHTSLTSGTKNLLEYPNLIKCRTQDNALLLDIAKIGWKKVNVDELDIHNILLHTDKSDVFEDYLAYTFEGGTQENSYFSKLEEPRLLNATIVGALTNNNGVYSGFSDNDYLMLNNLFTNDTTSFELIFKVKQTGRASNEGLLDSVLSTGQNIRFTITDSGYPRLRVNNTLSGNEYKVDITGTKAITLNNWGYYKATYNSQTGYSVSTSTDGINWEGTETSSELTAPLYQGGIIWYMGDNTASGSYLQGSIDMKETSITVNGATTTFTEFSDLYTYDGTNMTIADPQPIYTIKKPGLINAFMIGTLNSNNKGAYSGFSTSNYLLTTLPAYPSGTVNNFDIVFYFRTGSTINSEERIIMDATTQEAQNSFLIKYTSATGYQFRTSPQTGSHYCNVIENPSINTNYGIRAIYDGTTVQTYYCIDYGDWIESNSYDPSSVQFNTTSYSLGIRAQDGYSPTVFQGSIDMLNSYIEINNTKTTFYEPLSGLEIDNILYERTPNYDVPVKVGEVADKLKLTVDNTTYTLVQGKENMPIIDAGYLGILENQK